LSAGPVPISAYASSNEATQFVLPRATNDYLFVVRQNYRLTGILLRYNYGNRLRWLSSVAGSWSSFCSQHFRLVNSCFF
jgi:hypothetical protein